MSSPNFRHRLARALAALPLIVAVCACSAGGVRDEPPAGAWRLAGLAADARGPTLEFLADGRVAGHAGCNRFSGQVQWLAADGLRFGPVAATKMACMDARVAEREADFLRRLEAVAAWRRDGDALLLLAADGNELARLEPSPAAD
ncbi:MAG: META domain-containing protein [Pseudoxanthomonas sp.]|nr:META domain-containing protein [Pseudoxanthomonas sp.]